jgi:hypothetical protein
MIFIFISQVYTTHPAQNPKQASKRAKTNINKAKKIAMEILPNRYKTEIIKQKKKPIFAANFFGPAFIINGFILSIKTIFLLNTATGLFLPFKNPLIKKSPARKKIIHLTENIMNAKRKKAVIRPFILASFSLTHSLEIGHT